MPARVIAEPLSVVFEFPDATSWTARLDGLPNPRLASDLALGLSMRTHPHGGIGARNTANFFAVSVRHMVRALAAAGFSGGAADLPRALLVRYWLGCTHPGEHRTRMLLRGFDEATGALRPEVREHIAGRGVQVQPRRQPLVPYTDTEWDLLRDRCRQLVDDGFTAHRDVVAAAGRGGDPDTGGYTAENIAWMLLRDGPLNADRLPRRYLTRSGRTTPGKLPHAEFRPLRDALFPNRDVVIAYRLLMGVYSGIVPDGLDDIGLGDVEWAGDATVLLSYVKGRTGPEGAVLPRPAVRLLRQWLEHSVLLRRFAPAEQRDRLWLSTGASTAGSTVLAAREPEDRLRRWVRRHDLIVGGTPLPVHRARIRTTYHSRLARRGWSGRTTIDPNHSAPVEGDNYLTATTPAQQDAVEAIIESGQADVVRKAVPAVVLSAEQTAELVVDYPARVAELSMSGTALADLVGGQRDVFVAACADQLAGIHGPAGQPCPARPWVCLLCPLAVFLPRHAPNLLRLKAFFARQFRQMTTDQFLTVFGPFADRLDEILPRFDPRVLAAAAAETADTDAELPLRPEELTE